MTAAEMREAADLMRRLIEAVEAGGLEATGPKGIALLRRLEGAAAAFDASAAAEDRRSLDDPAEHGPELLPSPHSQTSGA